MNSIDLQTGKKIKLPSFTELLRILPIGVGGILLICSLFQNWFELPAANPLAKNANAILGVAPNCQGVIQTILAMAGVGFSLTYFFWNRQVIATLLACLMLFIALTFPYFVMMRSPVLAADATWLQMQHDNLTWLGGDIFSEAEAGMDAWKSKVYWVDPPRQVSVAPLPTWAFFEIGLDKVDEILVWLGYSNVFCQFARSGWFFAVLGSSFLVLSTLIRNERINESQAGYAVAFLSVLVLMGTTVALWGPFAAKEHLNNASNELSRGNYLASLEELKRCAKCFPVLEEDSYYVSQRAIIDSQLGTSSDFSRLHRAKLFEASGRYDQAFEIWNQLCHSPIAAIRRESLRAVLRFAIQDYNCNRIRLSRQRLSFVLERQPGNVKIIYYLQVIGVREEQTEEVYRMCQWMEDVTQYLNFGTTKILNASSQQNAKLAAALDGDAMETWIRSIEAR